MSIEFAQKLIADINKTMIMPQNRGKKLIILLGDKERMLLGAWAEKHTSGVLIWGNGKVEFYGRKVILCALDLYVNLVTGL